MGTSASRPRPDEATSIVGECGPLKQAYEDALKQLLCGPTPLLSAIVLERSQDFEHLSILDALSSDSGKRPKGLHSGISLDAARALIIDRTSQRLGRLHGLAFSNDDALGSLGKHDC